VTHDVDDSLRLVAYLDESRKPLRHPGSRRVDDTQGHYVVAAAILFAGEADQARAELLTLQKALGHDVHYSDLSRLRRCEVAEAIGRIPSWDGVLFETDAPVSSRMPDRRVRQRLLSTALPTLERDFGVSSLMLETRSAPLRGFVALDSHDHGTRQSLIARGELLPETNLAHVTKSEPLLWIADVVAGTRSDLLCGRDHATYPLLAHRVRRVVPWSV
jgi:hypothetical protein